MELNLIAEEALTMRQTGQQRALLKGRPRTQLPHGSERFTACSSEEIGPPTSRLVETPVPQRFGVGSDGQSLVWSPLKRRSRGTSDHIPVRSYAGRPAATPLRSG